jgi:hypothetical protein
MSRQKRTTPFDVEAQECAAVAATQGRKNAHGCWLLVQLGCVGLPDEFSGWYSDHSIAELLLWSEARLPRGILKTNLVAHGL